MYVYKRGDALYIADSGAQRVTVVNLSTKELFSVGGGGDGDLSLPVCVVTDRDGNIYVSDSGSRKVNKYDPGGRFIKSISREGLRPVGLAYDERSDTLYITNTANHSVLATDREGSVKFVIGERGEENGEFNFPTYLWVDSNGQLYVADTMNARIQIFDGGGKFLSKFGTRGGSYNELAGPKGVATDTHGNVYVVDSNQAIIKIFTRDGKLLLFFGDEGTEHGKFNLPNGIFIDRNNVIYVADTYNRRVQAFQLIEEK
jgi:DNA-binding beta-propeller fold protein YncE